MATLCRECGTHFEQSPKNGRCIACGSPRLISHAELDSLSIAHIDCDAFYASVEKRDNPELKDKPVIVGGGKRGVVAACCYIARIKGVHSAMPMYKALKACPDAVVVKSSRSKYSEVGRQIKDLMRDTTPLVESLSIDEAFLDLSGTEKLHGGSPATTLVKLIRRIEDEVGVTASVGLSYNKFLAKTASDLDKPRGFAIIGEAEALDFLAPRPVGSIWGVGKSMQAKLMRDGLSTISQLREMPEDDLIKRYGVIGKRLSRLSHGQDSRIVEPGSKAKSISTETTFSKNIRDFETLLHRLWPLCENVSNQLKNKNLAARTITMKLKTSGFKSLTRSRTLSNPTQLAEVIYREAKELLEPEANGTSYRLIGIGTSQFADPEDADLADLLDNSVESFAKIEDAMDEVRKKFGGPAIQKGRTLLKD
ncbi:MAG: DNA polymerase IV [Rhodospirillaceae bacterium]|jgi:DNA polymerase IV|nr:DNA polymerase IV [Rhodospirillaceae bacterium]MBT4588590.1 DNA polymerase IV [Rhodospirillaceae bacterium]MBT4937579.1 DNA polymerase IV [Rhodospirillaceae bacterium]MBT5941034.1 DNA polymerase IV [Rhodospirillaceae bacterium]MBT7266305.1 DNA polymerase IV [Rhodospirillaceae bacterium]